jgi:hypothetical protein
MCQFIEVDIPIPGLEIFEIHADTAPPEEFSDGDTNVHAMEVNLLPYSYTWSNGISVYSRNILHVGGNYSWPWYEEYTSANLVVINDWCLWETNRIRYKITANGETAVYTQHGDLIKPASLSISSDQLKLVVPRGTDVVVESSSDLKTWRSFQTIPWNKSSNTSFSINRSAPRSFYRVLVR